jgi:Fe-S cluster assembly iron-binding protein IscA
MTHHHTRARDIVVEAKGVNIIMSKSDAKYVNGSEIDYVNNFKDLVSDAFARPSARASTH